MMPDKGFQAATEVALRDLLEGHQVAHHLIQTPADALSILRHEAWHTAAGQYRRDQHQTVKSAADQTHHSILRGVPGKGAAYRRTIMNYRIGVNRESAAALPVRYALGAPATAILRNEIVLRAESHCAQLEALRHP